MGGAISRFHFSRFRLPFGSLFGKRSRKASRRSTVQKKIQYLVAFAILVLGVLLNIVPLGAQTATVRRPGAPTTTQAPPPPPTTTQAPPPPAAGALRITTESLPTLEVGREYNLSDLIKITGGTPYIEADEAYYSIGMDASSQEPFNYVCGDCFYPVVTPKREGTFSVNINVIDNGEGDKKQAVAKTYQVKVGSFNPTPKDIYEQAKKAADKVIPTPNIPPMPTPPSAEDNAAAVLATKVFSNANLAETVRQIHENTLPKHWLDTSLEWLILLVIGGLIGFVIGAMKPFSQRPQAETPAPRNRQ